MPAKSGWQRHRNYRKIRDASGAVVSYIITVDGADVPVTEAVFQAYARMERHERYLEEQSTACMTMDTGEQPSAEETYFQCLAEKENRLRLSAAVASLTAREFTLIDALYWRGLSVRAYAKEAGMNPMAVSREKKRILKRLQTEFFPDHCYTAPQKRDSK